MDTLIDYATAWRETVMSEAMSFTAAIRAEELRRFMLASKEEIK